MTSSEIFSRKKDGHEQKPASAKPNTITQFALKRIWSTSGQKLGTFVNLLCQSREDRHSCFVALVRSTIYNAVFNWIAINGQLVRLK